MGGQGGGIWIGQELLGVTNIVDFDVMLENVTVSDNSALSEGGGVWIGPTPKNTIGSLNTSINHTTITENRVIVTEGNAPEGGGLYSVDDSLSSTTLTHTIVSGNTVSAAVNTPNNVSGAIVSTSSYNILGSGGSANLPTGPGNQNNEDDPDLGPLMNNGGPTETHKPMDTSLAVDAGDPNFVAPPEFDQRGANFTRVVDAPGVNDSDGLRIDIGAVELRPAPYVLNVLFSNGTDTFDFAASGNIGSGKQVMQLPYEGLNTVTIEFSEPVDLPPTAIAVNRGLRLLGAYGTAYGIQDTPTGNGTTTVTWQLDASVTLPNIEMVLLELSDDITDLAVNALDGEWVNPKSTTTINESVSEFPSGDGIAGGDFQFAFVTHIPGDFNGDNYVESADLSLLLNFWAQLHDPNSNWITDLPTGFVGNDELSGLLGNWGKGWQNFTFLLMGDANGDYVVGSADLSALLGNWGESMATRSEGDLSGDGSVDADDLSALLGAWGLQVQFVD